LERLLDRLLALEGGERALLPELAGALLRRAGHAGDDLVGRQVAAQVLLAAGDLVNEAVKLLGRDRSALLERRLAELIEHSRDLRALGLMALARGELPSAEGAEVVVDRHQTPPP